MVCSIGGCSKKVKSHGWCLQHYIRWQLTGDPIVTTPCTVEGCPNEILYLGKLCSIHYYRKRKYGKLDQPPKRVYRHTVADRWILHNRPDRRSEFLSRGHHGQDEFLSSQEAGYNNGDWRDFVLDEVLERAELPTLQDARNAPIIPCNYRRRLAEGKLLLVKDEQGIRFFALKERHE